MHTFNFNPAALEMNERILEMRRQDRLTSMNERLLPALRKKVQGPYRVIETNRPILFNSLNRV